MTLKGWMLRKVNGAPGDRNRGDKRHAAPSLHGVAGAEGDGREPSLRGSAGHRNSLRETMAHLGPYAILIAAIREELEQFVASHLRLHLAIAERDRYVLTSIEVECEGSDEHRELLRRFVAEFKPEQIKNYLAREVIAGLSNASAIDLSQFAGLNAALDVEPPEQDDDYAGLLAELRSGAPGSVPRPYAVSLVGRWSPADVATSAAGAARASREKTRLPAKASTPLAGQSFSLDIEDAAGARDLELGSVVPGRSYVVGKDDDCDVVVDGVYVSRRHCEIWFDDGAWWAADLASTNGLRVEVEGAVVARTYPKATEGVESIELPAGAWLVLSANAEGGPAKCPRLALRRLETIPAVVLEPAALATPIAPARRRRGTLTVAAHMASGLREADVVESTLPFRVGRSRNQELVIDWKHDEVSARHIEIVAVDEAGASVVVHGDNGVTIEGNVHGAGAHFRWEPGQTLLLGRVDGKAPACTLTLSRAA